jgi:PAS domain S-box-containing protein
VERLQHLYSNQSFGLIATLIISSLLAANHYNIVNHGFILLWWMTIWGVTFGRGLLVRRFLPDHIQIEQVGRWKLWFRAGALLSGILWGVAGIVLFPVASDAQQMFTVFCIGGLVAGASVTYSVYPDIFLSFCLPAILPVIILSLSFRDSVHVAMAFGTILFVILMTATCFRNCKLILTSIKLTFEKQDLIEYLSRAKDKAESINRQLQTEINIRKQVENELKHHRMRLTSTVESRTAELRKRNRELQAEITERSRIETALRDSEERYRRLVENNIMGIILIQDQQIVFANTFISNISGMPLDRIIGSPFSKFLHNDDREHVVDKHLQRINGGPSDKTYPLRIVDVRGEVHWLEVSAMLMTYENKPAVLVFCRDITQQCKLELQLFQSEKMASIGQLAAGVAHEINNPVGFVNSNLHSLEEYQQDVAQLIARYREAIGISKAPLRNSGNASLIEKIKAIEQFEADIDLDYILKDWCQLIQESMEGTERIKNIVHDLKGYAHPGNDRRQMADINKCIESTLNIVWNELKYKVNIIKEFGELPQLECFPQQLNQVFMNLLVNAGQSISDQGKIKIQTLAKNNHVEIVFSDTGRGMPREHLTKVFDPFFTTKDIGKGTGLGLHVSYNIIKKHNGTMEVSSTVGKGTTFTIQLPLKTKPVSNT